MTPREAKLYSAYLEKAAITISRDRSYPLDIELLCKDLDIQLRTDARDVSRAQLEVNGQTCRLNVAPANPSLARFYVAHEIGHALLFREYGVLPSGESEYWQHELLCDSFARHLLLPDVTVRGIGGDDFIDAKSALYRIHQIAARYGVPSCHVVAIRLREEYPSLGVFELSRRTDRDSNRASLSTEFKVSFSSLPGKKAIGTLISSNDPNFTALSRIQAQGSEGGEIDGAALLRALFPKRCCETTCTASAFAIGTRGRIRVAVVSNFLEKGSEGEN